MRKEVREHNIYRWAGNLIAELCAVRLDEPANKLPVQLGNSTGEPSTETIRIDQSIDDFDHARPVTAAGDHVGSLFERGQGVGHGD
jgi:hypothetical protein